MSFDCLLFLLATLLTISTLGLSKPDSLPYADSIFEARDIKLSFLREVIKVNLI